MSTEGLRSIRSFERPSTANRWPGIFRLLALAGVATLVAAYVSVLLDVTAVVGGSRELVAVTLAAAGAGVLVARSVAPRVAAVLALLLGVLGFVSYFSATGASAIVVLGSIDQLVSDAITLATGLTMLAIVDADLWARAYAPAPAFLSCYFAMRRRYVLAVVAGGVALQFLVLTGDAPMGTTLAGVVGAIAAIGFGELEMREGTFAQADVLAILFTVVVVLALTVSLVPAGALEPVTLVEGEQQGFEGSITGSADSSSITGSADPSPEVRFTVRSEEPGLWRTGVYDRFTGTEWIRTGQANPYEGPIEGPPGDTERVHQTVIVEDNARTMPALAEPVVVDGEASENTMIDSHGAIAPDGPLIPGDMYNVESAVVDHDPEALEAAGTDYPEHVEERYLQQPADQSDEFDEATAAITANADNPYETAVILEQYFTNEYGYSLQVGSPGANVAEEFLFEMEEGYCVYFATTMVQMLRSEEIPARYAVGYTTGQQVDDNEWVVRGMNAHAWVEVYFPDHGWVAFDPTPAEPRDLDRTNRLEEARHYPEDDLVADTDASRDVPPMGIEESQDEPPLPGNETNESFLPDDGDAGDPMHPDLIDEQLIGPDDQNYGEFDPDELDFGTDDDEESEADDEPTGPGALEEYLVLAIALVVGLAAGIHRTGAADRVRRSATVHWQGFRRSPDEDVERAYRRLELHLTGTHRSRKPGESTRQYLRQLSTIGVADERASRVGRAYERARYGHGVNREEADEIVATVDEIVAESTPILQRLRR